MKATVKELQAELRRVKKDLSATRDAYASASHSLDAYIAQRKDDREAIKNRDERIDELAAKLTARGRIIESSHHLLDGIAIPREFAGITLELDQRIARVK